MSNTIMPTYFSQLPIAFEHGKGAWLYDTEGKTYLDSLCGIAVCALGHAHPAITEAICDQAAKVIHTSNTYLIPLQQKLADHLTRIANMDQAFFCNSGAEANETAIKMTRQFARKKNIAEPLIVVMEKAFHGRTMATATASNERIRDGFEPLLPGFIRIPFNNIDALRKLESEKNIVAVMLEPIQGEGGIHAPNDDYLREIRELCDKHDWLMILDEVQTGLCRTGKWFAHQYSNITPDILTIAKALANGIPMGACVARGKANNLFAPGKHGSTFGGNPFACRVACTVLDVMEKEKIAAHVEKVGGYLKDKLKETFKSNPVVLDVRGKGLMLGVELDRPCRDIMATGAKHGLLFNVTSNTIIRLLPPLIITQNEADEIVLRLKKTIEEFFA